MYAAIESHALTLGRFDRVGRHEPKTAPGAGLTAAIIGASLAPVPEGSGLAATTGRVAFTVRIYSNMLQEPQDGIDPAILSAADQLVSAISGDYTLGATVRNVDLLGQAGEPLGWNPGYIEQDRTMYRIVVVTVPLIVNDVYTQAA